jgi:hypothetical protein
MKKLLFSFLTLVLITPAYTQTLLGKWDFTAGAATDLTGNGYDGSLMGSAYYDYDRFNFNASAVHCTSGSDFIATTCPGVSGNGSRTITFWAKVPSSSTGGGGVNYGGGPVGGDFNLYFNVFGPTFSIDISDETREWSVPSFTDDKWHQYAISFDSTSSPFLSSMNFYRDGILLTNLAGAYNYNGHALNTATTTSFRMGLGDISIDDVRLFSSPMTTHQIDSLFMLEAPVNPCLIARYDFTGNANDGVSSYNGSVNGATPSVDRFGNLNSAYNFNGTSDYIDVTVAPDLSHSNMTIGFWAKRGVQDATWRVAVSQGTAATDSGLHCGFTGTLNPYQEFGFDFSYDGVYDSTNASKTDWNQWYVTFDSLTNEVNFYCNGVLTKTDTTNDLFLGSGPMYFGRTAWGGNFYSGDLDDIKIFNCELSGSQIDSIYQFEKIPPCALTVSVTTTQPSCYGDSNGTATANVTSEVGSVYYSWSTSATTQTITGLATGGYTVNVTDDLGCSASYSANVYEPGPMSFYSSYFTQPWCYNECSGVGNFYTSGGNGGESWLWSPSGQTTAYSANNLCAGTHTVTVTDMNGCTVTDSFTMVSPTQIQSNLSIVSVISCNGVCDGSLGAAPSGGTPYTGGGLKIANPALNGQGTPPYTVNWQPIGVIADTVMSLCAGTYTVSVTDGNGCMITDSVVLNEPLALIVTASGTNPICPDVADGTANAAATGGNAPYNFNWSNSMSGDTITGLDSIAMLVVNVTDNNGCAAADTISIGSAPVFYVTLSANPSTCGASSGSVNAVVTGGLAPFVYYWSNSESTQNISSVPADNYFLQVTDANGCYASDAAIVNDSDGPSVTVTTTTPVSCAGAANGAIDISISGGATPYAIQWSTNETTEDISNLNGGSYDLVVTDMNGCLATMTIPVAEPDTLMLSASSVSSACTFSNGKAYVMTMGGTAPYAFLWDASAASQTTDTAFNVASGLYHVLVTDAMGCSDSIYVAVSDSTGPAIEIDSVKNAGCILNGGNGEIYTTSTGTGPFEYMWSNGATTDDITGLGIGSFALIVTDSSSGCRSAVSQYIRGERPGTAQICMLTVDTATNQNVIIWNDTVQGIAQYEIFRESSVAGVYNRISTIAAGTGNTFIDTVANPDNKPWRYEIKTTDSCGRVSVFSLAHKTIHLTVAADPGGFNLSWDAYQGTGVVFTHYVILRYVAVSGWVVVDSVPVGSPLTYFDTTSPDPGDTNYYFVEINSDAPCNASGLRASDPSVMAAVKKSRSNIQNNKLNTLSVKEEEAIAISVYPNPSKNEFNIRFDKSGKYALKVYDARGRTIVSENVNATPQTTSQLKSGAWEAGVYIVQITSTEGKVKNVKLIKQ